MLSSLIKHEWKETWKVPGLSCIVMIAMTLVSVIAFSKMEAPTQEEALNMGAFLLMMFYCLMVCCISLLMTIYFAVRFYKNLYSDEGYLMHTLPVTPRQLIASKTLIGTLWVFVLSLLSAWSVCCILAFAFPVLAAPSPEVTLDWFLSHAGQLFGMPLPAFVLLYVILSAVSALSSVLIIYGAISLGQLFSKHKVMASILCYVGFTMLIQTVVTFAMTPVLTKMVITAGVSGEFAGSDAIPAFFGLFMRTALCLSLIGSTVSAAAGFILTEYVMKKQLNLD